MQRPFQAHLEAEFDDIFNIIDNGIIPVHEAMWEIVAWLASFDAKEDDIKETEHKLHLIDEAFVERQR